MDKHSPTNVQLALSGEPSQKDHDKSKGNLTAKDSLFIATECHLALFPDEDGDTALHLAVVKGDLEACRKLLDLFRIAGKSIDVHNNLLQTPLHVAVITDNKEIVKLLVSHGSDPNNPDRYGSTAFHLCAKFDFPDCFMEILKSIGTRKPALNCRDYEGHTALHVAVLRRARKIFPLLVAHGADIDAKDNKGGRTPLIYAIEMNEKGFVETLLERDASVSQQTYSGDTALHIASGRGLQDIVRLLLRRGADATMKNTHFETPMSLASSPMLTDILRTSYGSAGSPDSKLITATDSQIITSHYIARNNSGQLPPHYVKMTGIPREQTLLQKRGLNLKTERQSMESDEAPPPKRPNLMDAITVNRSTGALNISRSALNGYGATFLPKVTVKHEYIEPAAEGRTSSNINVETGKENAEDDLESTKASDSFEESVEIAMEEVEVSAEEELATRSDEEDKSDDSHSPPLSQDDKTTQQEQPYTHKLMQCTNNLLNKNATMASVALNMAKAHEIRQKDNLEEKPVIVQKQPQIDSATALRDFGSMENSNGPLNVSLASATSQAGAVKSKSVPNSPQPAEANLYQLAREGLAVAAMANSASSQAGVSREFGLSNYLKARPSRQAKIKSGTEELQNLALQGLAVANMNAQPELLPPTNTAKKKKAADDTDVKATISTDMNPYTHAMNNMKEGQPPLLLRSNSLPPKHLYEPGSHMQSPANQVSSNHALLALAHANARKEHVGQAVSAISMGKAQLNTGSKFLPMTSGQMAFACDVSDATKHNLRQAIMVKNSPPHNLKFQASNSFLPTDQLQVQNHTLTEVITPDNPTSTISLKLLPSVRQHPANSSSSTVMIKATTVALTTTANKTELERTKTPEKLAVFNVKIQRKLEKTVDSHTSKSTIQQSTSNNPLREPIVSIQSTTSVAQGVKTKDPAPTHTVAPLQTADNHTISPLKSDTGKQQTLVSVATAPVVTPRISTPPPSLPPPAVKHTVAVTSEASAVTQVHRDVAFSNMPATAVTTIPQVTLGIHPQQILNQAPLPVAQPSPSFVQPQIAYIPHGKDLIPVVLPPSALPPQLQYPPYAALPGHSSQAITTCSEKPKSIIDPTGSNTNVQFSGAYASSYAKLPAVDPSLLRPMPLPLQDAQMRGYYPVAAPLYGAPQQFDLMQQQQHLLRNALLYQQQQSMLTHGRIGSTVSALVNSKPVAAVSAVPVPKSMKPASSISIPEEQPLNLSKKSEQSSSDTEQPLNLMKAQAPVHSESSARGSVIKSAVSSQKDPVKTDRNEATRAMEQQHRSPVSGTSALHVGQPAHGVYLPPPVIINSGGIPPSVTNSAALSALSLPPIHYVNGMPFIFGVPPQL